MSDIRTLLASLDDSDWEALGSKGLLRRATKDLEKGISCDVVTDTPLELAVRVGDATVTVPPEGPAKARCTCGTPGCCQHLIAAGLFLRKQTKSTPLSGGPSASDVGGVPAPLVEAPTNALPTLLGLDYSVVHRWSGAAAWRAALRMLTSGVSADVRDDGATIMVHLNPIEVQCRFLAGVGLDGAIVTGGDAKATKTYVAAAVVALKTKHGEPLPAVEKADAVLGEEKGAPRTRADVLGTTNAFLESTVAAGLSHASAATAERFATLAVSADGTNLPRLARILKSVADELTLIATRHGRADTERALDTMAFAYALSTATAKAGSQPPGHLIGGHRTGYVDIHELELIGVAAFPWRARSGFRGITVLFWDVARKRWSTWTEARSDSADPRYDPLKAFDGECPWGGTISIRSLAESRVKLVQAKQNAGGRLSSTRECKAQRLGPANLSQIEFDGYAFRSWETLHSYIASTNAIGLKPADPVADWVVLTPTRWGQRAFDRVTQRFVWFIVDEAGKELPLTLTYTDLTRLGIEHLEGRDEPTPRSVSVVGRLLREAGQLAVEPLALIPSPRSGFRAVNLLVPAPGTKVPAASVTPAPAPEEPAEIEDTEPDEEQLRVTSRWLRLAREYLTSRAEAGVATIPAHRTGPANPADKLMNAGLSLLGSALPQIDAGPPSSAATILRVAYILRLHEQSPHA